jgi:hypothetical protein
MLATPTFADHIADEISEYTKQLAKIKVELAKLQEQKPDLKAYAGLKKQISDLKHKRKNIPAETGEYIKEHNLAGIAQFDPIFKKVKLLTSPFFPQFDKDIKELENTLLNLEQSAITQERPEYAIINKTKNTPTEQINNNQPEENSHISSKSPQWWEIYYKKTKDIRISIDDFVDKFNKLEPEQQESLAKRIKSTFLNLPIGIKRVILETSGNISAFKKLSEQKQKGFVANLSEQEKENIEKGLTELNKIIDAMLKKEEKSDIPIFH